MAIYCKKDNVCISTEEVPMILRDDDTYGSLTVLQKHRESSKNKITMPDHAVKEMKIMPFKDREECRILHLDSKNRVIGSETASIGSLNTAIIHPREIFKSAILNNANSIIFAHNHPSGDTTPSDEDIRTSDILQRINCVGF